VTELAESGVSVWFFTVRGLRICVIIIMPCTQLSGPTAISRSVLTAKQPEHRQHFNAWRTRRELPIQRVHRGHIFRAAAPHPGHHTLR
jgi:hypothetical protein